MYTVEFYKDANDRCEIGEYFAELAEKAKTDKNARINMNKIAEYILLLKRNGTRIGYPVVRPIEGDVWELRPLKNRIFFFYWKENKFVLLSHYMKKSQKAPKRGKGKHARLVRKRGKIIMKAYTNFEDMLNDPEYFSEEDKAEINFEVALIEKVKEMRESTGLSQTQLAKASGVKQSAIARMESMKAVPQIATLIKLLVPMGYTLDIVPLRK